MIEQLLGLPAHTVGFKLSGKLHDEDYKKFVPLVDAEIAKEGKVTQQKPAAGTEVTIGTRVDLQLTGGRAFVDRLTRSVTADRSFATLEVAPTDLRTRLVEAKVTTPKAAARVVEMENQQLQATFGLRNLTHARSFRRMVRDALAQLEADG